MVKHSPQGQPNGQSLVDNHKSQYWSEHEVDACPVNNIRIKTHKQNKKLIWKTVIKNC